MADVVVFVAAASVVDVAIAADSAPAATAAADASGILEAAAIRGELLLLLGPRSERGSRVREGTRRVVCSW